MSRNRNGKKSSKTEHEVSSGGAPRSSQTIPPEVLEGDQPDWARLKAHPEFNERWVVLYLSRQRVIPKTGIRDIFLDRDFRKSREIRLALMACRSAPASLTANMVPTLRWGDLLKLLRAPWLPGALRSKIIAQFSEIFPRLTLGEKITVARQAPRPLIRWLRTCEEERVLDVVLMNGHFTYEDALFMANYPKIARQGLEALVRCEKWARMPKISRALIAHPRLPNALVLDVLRRLSPHVLKRVAEAPNIPVFRRRIAMRLLDSETGQPSR